MPNGQRSLFSRMPRNLVHCQTLTCKNGHVTWASRSQFNELIPNEKARVEESEFNISLCACQKEFVRNVYTTLGI